MSLKYSPLDQIIIRFDQNIVKALNTDKSAMRPSPADSLPEADLDDQSREHIAALMRINHAGEVSAQALYQGQALMARESSTREKMQQSAEEELDHLAWCEQRIRELGGHTSLFDPLWYVGSLSLGMLAGLAGDRWSLGFIEETERQVVEHLQGHLDQLPDEDKKSSAILEQMQIDEAEHGDKAAAAGAAKLPDAIRNAMRVCSRIMTRSSYHI